MTALVVLLAWLLLSLVTGAVCAALGWYVREAMRLSEQWQAEVAAVLAPDSPSRPSTPIA